MLSIQVPNPRNDGESPNLHYFIMGLRYNYVDAALVEVRCLRVPTILTTNLYERLLQSEELHVSHISDYFSTIISSDLIILLANISNRS